MILVADVGNTNITFGIFDAAHLKVKFAIPTKPARTPGDYSRDILSVVQDLGIKNEEIEAVVIASVVPEIMTSFICGVKKGLNREPLLINSETKTGITVITDSPAELGADRLVNAAAAYAIYGGPLLIVDAGTATTYDFVTEKGEFLGGAIAPGIKLCAEALAEKTAMLPKIEISKPVSSLGKNTVSSMQVGLVYGYIGQAEYIIRQMKEELCRDMTVIATGGLSFVFKDSTNAIDIYDTDLTLKGLKYLYTINSSSCHLPLEGQCHVHK